MNCTNSACTIFLSRHFGNPALWLVVDCGAALFTMQSEWLNEDVTQLIYLYEQNALLWDPNCPKLHITSHGEQGHRPQRPLYYTICDYNWSYYEVSINCSGAGAVYSTATVPSTIPLFEPTVNYWHRIKHLCLIISLVGVSLKDTSISQTCGFLVSYSPLSRGQSGAYQLISHFCLNLVRWHFSWYSWRRRLLCMFVLAASNNSAVRAVKLSNIKTCCCYV